MPTIFQPAMGSRGTVAHEAPSDRNGGVSNAPVNGMPSGLTVNGHRPTVNPNAVLPGIDDGTRVDVNQIDADDFAPGADNDQYCLSLIPTIEIGTARLLALNQRK